MITMDTTQDSAGYISSWLINYYLDPEVVFYFISSINPQKHARVGSSKGV